MRTAERFPSVLNLHGPDQIAARIGLMCARLHVWCRIGWECVYHKRLFFSEKEFARKEKKRNRSVTRISCCILCYRTDMNSLEQTPAWEARFLSQSRNSKLYGTERSVTVFITAPRFVPALSQKNPVHVIPSHFCKYILILSSHLPRGLCFASLWAMKNITK